MPQVKLISPITRQEIRKVRVAAYCRVSSNSADQQNSYTNQIRVYTSLIQRKKEWELVEIFADEGLSGMNAQNRTEFQRMIKMCEQHQIDLIVTKSVSRFARNAKESLEYVRKLKLLGVGVQFEKEGIYTLALGDEMQRRQIIQRDAADLRLDVVFQKALRGFEGGRSEFYSGVVLHPHLQPATYRVGLGPSVVDADVFLDGFLEFLLDFGLRLAEDIFDDGLASFWIVTDCVAALPASVLSFSDIAFSVCSSLWHKINPFRQRTIP